MVTEPTYVYDLSQLRRTASYIKDAFKHQEAMVLFATMANPRPEILETLSELGIGACVNSVAHLRAAIRAGMQRDRIQFTSSGLSTEDLEEIASFKVQCNVDSAWQAAMLMDISKGAACGVRVNTRLLLAESVSAYDRLGLDPGDVPALSSMVESRSGRLNGAHIYVGTNFRSHIEMLPALDRFFSVAATVSALDYVNVGGGIGVDYTRLNHEFEVNDYARAIGQRLDALREKLARQVQLVVEPGRAIVASSGYFTCRVTDVKKLGDRIFVGVNASVAQFPRPWHHPETPHQVYAAKLINDCVANDVGETMDAVIAGRTTYSKDVLSTARLPTNLKVGDALIFADAGAYCDSMASRFLGQPDTESIFLN
ncbi:diaminopimelate decarboxylase [Burkholderia sp. JP2-270]|nr:diaminopimelate decarboxylase [Burkholderia sp. JP2-270]